MNIIGISAFYHDSAVALVRDGIINAAFQEERFSRVKHDERFPAQSMDYLFSWIKENGYDNLDAFVFYEKPLLKFDRILENYLSFAPRGFVNFRDSLPLWSQKKLFQRRNLVHEIEKLLEKNHINIENLKSKIYFSDHHLSHAASAFYPSPFSKACVVTIDGVGEWTSTAIYRGENEQLTPIKRIEYPHSLGLLYSTFTSFCGFKVNSGEYKLMGLAPYGEPRFADFILDELISLKSDGSYTLNLKYFDFMKSNRMYSKELKNLLKVDPRDPESEIGQVYCDLASSIQRVLELAILNLVKSARDVVDLPNLCIAGGVALNCVANSEITRSGIFEKIWIQPAAGDAGGAIGSALAFEYMSKKSSTRGKKRLPPQQDLMNGGFLGREFQDDEILSSLKESKLNFHAEDSIPSTIEIVADKLSQGLSVGWFQGRSEFGPRSLGARSILADPRSPTTQKRLNLQTKFRESFRPFAPSVLEEEVENWFDWNESSPYMLFVAQVKERHRTTRAQAESRNRENENIVSEINKVRSTIPAVTHVDFSARIQTVSKDSNPYFHELISSFHQRTGVPILVNTSFNIRGEPIVDSPEDAIKCFLGTDIDLLVMGKNIIYKADNIRYVSDYRDQYKLD